MLKLTAKCTVKPDKIEAFKVITSEMIDQTRLEDGCGSYELFQDLQDEAIFIFIESWASSQALDAHSKNLNDAGFVARLGEVLAKDLEIHVMSLVK